MLYNWGYQLLQLSRKVEAFGARMITAMMHEKVSTRPATSLSRCSAEVDGSKKEGAQTAV
jgi:hypothetical protein